MGQLADQVAKLVEDLQNSVNDLIDISALSDSDDMWVDLDEINDMIYGSAWISDILAYEERQEDELEDDLEMSEWYLKDD